MVPVSLILVLGKASFGKMDFLVILFEKGLTAVSEAYGPLGVRPTPRGGAAFTQKSERLSDQIQKTSFQIWDLTFCSPRAALLALDRLFCSGEEVGVFRVNPVFLMPHWPMDMAALMGRSCTSDQAKKHMFFRSYTAFVSFV
jgi:hypothetical protein